METYFYNTGNKQHYKILARYFDDVMLLETKNHNYIVARWVGITDEDFFMGGWGSGHYWMDNKQGAIDDFFNTAYEEYKYNHAWEEQMTIEEFKRFYEEY